MKVLATTIGICILLTCTCKLAEAQKVNYTTRGGWTIGLGAGTSYQKSDIANSKGFGIDFNIGSQLFQKENAFLGVDWKFRFLAGQNTAYDHRFNPDDTYSNIRYKFLSYDLELGLTLNRLRERTGIVLAGFAGAGLTHGRTYTDLYDDGGNLYDFGSIDPNRDSKLVYRDLVELSDGDFETSLVNKVAILPTAGIYLGYQISRSLTIGVEYKTNFYITEENSLFGIDLDNKAISGSAMDRNNYISLGIGWIFKGGYSSRGGSAGYAADVHHDYGKTTVTSNRDVPVSPAYPSVQITEPSAEIFHSVSPNHTIRAIIEQVSGPENISFFQNGYPVNSFTYNVNTNSFTANVRLRDGENDFRIQAVNRTSSAEDRVSIILDVPAEEVIPPPLAAFTSPSGEQYTSSSDRIDITASVKNVSRKEDIQLTMNGFATPFEFYPYSGLVKTSISGNGLANLLLIQASNQSGSAQDQLTLHFMEPEIMFPPSVRLIDPLYPVEVRNEHFPLRAEIQNVFNPNDIELIINGYGIDNFSFDTDGQLAVNLLLSEGINTIEIFARNDAGIASDRTSITYRVPVYFRPVILEPPVRGYPPEIHITNPISYPSRTFERSEELRATVLNVYAKENILLHVNGTGTRNFNYNSGTRELMAMVPLREGENVLTIRAQNESGEDVKEQVIIKETRPCPSPVIRLIDPSGGRISTDLQTYPLRAEVRNVTSSNQLRLSVNGKSVTYNFNGRILSSSIPLVRGNNSIALNAVNECGEVDTPGTISYSPTAVRIPCTPPVVTFTLQEVNREDATHELTGSVTGVKNKSDISIALDGSAVNGFQYLPSTGELHAKFRLTPGSHTFSVYATNACGEDSKYASVSLEDDGGKEKEQEKGCGIRINPGNSDWQFCLVTPSGTFSRADLSNSNFSYSGRATSLYFLPIGGGGEATVNGRPYAISPGQYYLFTGNLNVSISTRNPGSMGHWSVCISADRAPQAGNGNSRPGSPCEAGNKENGRGNNSGIGNSSSNNGRSNNSVTNGSENGNNGSEKKNSSNNGSNDLNNDNNIRRTTGRTTGGTTSGTAGRSRDRKPVSTTERPE